MILKTSNPAPVQFGVTVPPPRIHADLPEGIAAVDAWRKKWAPTNLKKLAAASRAAENPPELIRARAAVAALQRRIKSHPTGSIEKGEAERQLASMEAQVVELNDQAQAASRQVFCDPSAFPGYVSDLQSMVRSLENEVENILAAHRKFYKSLGYPEPGAEYIFLCCAGLQRLNDLLESSARERLKYWTEICRRVEAGEQLPQPFRAEDIVWLLGGCSWSDARKKF